MFIQQRRADHTLLSATIFWEQDRDVAFAVDAWLRHPDGRVEMLEPDFEVNVVPSESGEIQPELHTNT